MPQDQSPIIVEIEGLGELEFPAGTAQGIIESTVRTELAKAKNQPAKSSMADTAADLLPSAGGIIGGFAGGKAPVLSAITAGIGGAAGEGYRQLLKHGTEIPGALIDVVRNTFQQPQATAQGFGEGMQEGLQSAAIQGGLQAGTEAAGGLVGRAVGGASKAVYRGYLKPSLSKQMAPRAAQTVETGIRERLPVTRAGLAAGQSTITGLKSQVDDILATTKDPTDLKTIADRVRTWAKGKYDKPGHDPSEYRKALEVADRIDKHPSLMVRGPDVAQEVVSPILTAEGKPITRTQMVRGPDVPDTIATATKVNAVKRAIDESAGEAAFGVKTGAEKTAEKRARNLLRQRLENIAEKVGPLNARESKLIDTTKAIAAAVGRESNKDRIVGWRGILAGAGATGSYASNQDPVASLGWYTAIQVGLSPAVATRVAITAHRLAKTAGISAQSAARLAVYAVNSESED